MMLYRLRKEDPCIATLCDAVSIASGNSDYRWKGDFKKIGKEVPTLCSE